MPSTGRIILDMSKNNYLQRQKSFKFWGPKITLYPLKNYPAKDCLRHMNCTNSDFYLI